MGIAGVVILFRKFISTMITVLKIRGNYSNLMILFIREALINWLVTIPMFLLFDRSGCLNGNVACLLLILQKLHFKLEFVEQ